MWRKKTHPTEQKAGSEMKVGTELDQPLLNLPLGLLYDDTTPELVQC